MSKSIRKTLSSRRVKSTPPKAIIFIRQGQRGETDEYGSSSFFVNFIVWYVDCRWLFANQKYKKISYRIGGREFSIIRGAVPEISLSYAYLWGSIGASRRMEKALFFNSQRDRQIWIDTFGKAMNLWTKESFWMSVPRDAMVLECEKYTPIAKNFPNEKAVIDAGFQKLVFK